MRLCQFAYLQTKQPDGHTISRVSRNRTGQDRFGIDPIPKDDKSRDLKTGNSPGNTDASHAVNAHEEQSMIV
jgi:hypothetical protein